MVRRRRVAKVVALVAFCTVAGWGVDRAGAEPILENDRLRVDLGGLVRAGGGTIVTDGEEPDYGFFVQNARLKMAIAFEDYAQFVVRYGGGSGDVGLVDAYGEWTAFDPLFLRVGRFKTPVSREYLISSTRLPFATRALLNDFVPGRRAGIELYARLGEGPVVVQPELGIFQPVVTQFSPASLGLGQRPQGQLLAGRLLVGTEFGLDIHVGYAGHVFAENEIGPNHPQNPTDSSMRVVEFDHPLDAALTYDRERWDLHLEGLTVLDPPRGEPLWGGYLHGGYRFGPPNRVQPEPIAAYDVVAYGDVVHRATAGLNVHWWETPVYTILNYRFQTTVDGTDDGAGTPPDSHGIFVLLSASV